MKATFWRMEIVLNTKTLEIGDVQTDPLGGLYRRVVPVRVNCYGEPNYNIEWRAKDCLSLGFNQSHAWATLTKLRDTGVYVKTDPRLGVPYAVREQVEAA